MNPSQNIFDHLDTKPFSLPGFLRKNFRGILGTLMFHMILVIVFLLIKINKFKQATDLNITFDYLQTEPELTQSDKSPLTQQEQAYFERIIAQAEKISNRASNISEDLDKEISTENFVNDYLKKLDEERSEEWRLRQEEINKKLEEPDYVLPLSDTNKEIEMDEYTGPSNISYEFLDAPFNRFKVYLPVPVYKCQGEGIVNVNIIVDQIGKVVSADPFLAKDYTDKDCLLEIARNYALKTRFEGNFNAPKLHKARIIYSFVPQ